MTKPKKTYKAYTYCNNCTKNITILIPYGKEVGPIIKTALCSNCGCKKTLRQRY